MDFGKVCAAMPLRFQWQIEKFWWGLELCPGFSQRLQLIQQDGYKNKYVIEKLTLKIYIWEIRLLKLTLMMH